MTAAKSNILTSLNCNSGSISCWSHLNTRKDLVQQKFVHVPSNNIPDNSVTIPIVQSTQINIGAPAFLCLSTLLPWLLGTRAYILPLLLLLSLLLHPINCIITLRNAVSTGRRTTGARPAFTTASIATLRHDSFCLIKLSIPCLLLLHSSNTTAHTITPNNQRCTVLSNSQQGSGPYPLDCAHKVHVLAAARLDSTDV